MLCRHSNETCAPIANPPNNAQLEGTSYHSPKLHPGPCSSVGMRQGTDTQTHVTNIHFAPSMTRAKCNKPHNHHHHYNHSVLKAVFKANLIPPWFSASTGSRIESMVKRHGFYRSDAFHVIQPTTGNSQHRPKPGKITHWPHPLFIYHWTPDTTVLTSTNRTPGGRALLPLCRLSDSWVPSVEHGGV